MKTKVRVGSNDKRDYQQYGGYALSVRQYAVLSFLFRNKKPATTSEFREYLNDRIEGGLPAYAVTSLLNNMARKGLLAPTLSENGPGLSVNTWKPTADGKAAYKDNKRLLTE